MNNFLWEYRARITREDLGPRKLAVHDGDTIRVDVDLGFTTYKMQEPLRLLGINTAEKYGKTKEAGEAARGALLEYLPKDWFFMRTVKDKRGARGRYLAAIYDPNTLVNINWRMIEDGWSKPTWYSMKVPDWWGPHW